MKVLVLGGGISGMGAAKLAKKIGYNVKLSDAGMLKENYKAELADMPIEFEEGEHSATWIENADLIIKSPGIPTNADIIQHAFELSKEVIGEIEFASRHTDAKLIAITGSNGKTTTTNLTYNILKNGGLNVAMVGNVGESFAAKVAEQDNDIYVIEMSSFQLDDCTRFKPNIAIVLNITPDHLNRYNNDINLYAKSKMSIVINQDEKDVFIYCKDDEITMQHLDEVPKTVKKIAFTQVDTLSEGAYRDHQNIEFIINKNHTTMSIYDLAIQGRHNVYNNMAAGIVANLMGIRKESIRQSMQDFKNLEHRMESVGFIRGIQFINDSKATNVNSTWYALESMNQKVVWIAGGVNKGNDYTSLLPLVKNKVRALICLGKDNKHLINVFGKDIEIIEQTRNMKDAVKMAYYLAGKEDIVLLSPACASFDLFSNYEDRGNQFKQAVREL